MDETGDLLNAFMSIKVLEGKNNCNRYRDAAAQRTLITAVSWIPGHVISG